MTIGSAAFHGGCGGYASQIKAGYSTFNCYTYEGQVFQLCAYASLVDIDGTVVIPDDWDEVLDYVSILKYKYFSVC